MSTEHLIKHLPNDAGGVEAGPIAMTEHTLLPWEKRCHALLDILDYRKIINTEEKRRAVEELGSELMGKLTYYERWIVGAANLTPDEIARKTAEVEARFGEEAGIQRPI